MLAVRSSSYFHSLLSTRCQILLSILVVSKFVTQINDGRIVLILQTLYVGYPLSVAPQPKSRKTISVVLSFILRKSVFLSVQRHIPANTEINRIKTERRETQIVKTILVVLVPLESFGFNVPNNVSRIEIGSPKKRNSSNKLRKLSFVNSNGVNCPTKGITKKTKIKTSEAL